MKDYDDMDMLPFITLRALTLNVIEYLRPKQIQKSKLNEGDIDEPHNERCEPDQGSHK
jgi:hypothetical protein